MASIKYFIASITDKSCKFTAYPCNSEDDFNKGECLKCSSPNGCNKMGYYSSQIYDKGSLYLNTQNIDEKRLCLQNYKIKLYSDDLNNMKKTRGKFTISFKSTSKKTSSTEIIDDSDTEFMPNSTETRFISLKNPISSNSTIDSAFITFTKNANYFSSWTYNSKRSFASWFNFFDEANYDDKWSFRLIEILDGEKQLLIKLCPECAIIESSKGVEFKKC